MKFKRLTAGIAAVAVALGGIVLTATPAAAATGYTYTVPAGTVMSNGDSIRSSKGQFQFVMQADGNAVIYGTGNQVLWQSGTSGNANARLVPQSDGNVVIYRASGASLWQSGSSGKGGTRFTMGDDGNAAMLNGSAPVWATFSHQDSLYPGTALKGGELLRSDFASNYELRMQEDGNLVEYQGSKVVWQSGTDGNPGAVLTYQRDGNLTIVANNRALWSSGTAGQSAGRVYLDSTGAFRVHDANGTARWGSTGTKKYLIVPATGTVFGNTNGHCQPPDNSHGGIDISRSTGGPIYAAAGGVVTLHPRGNTTGGYGNYITVDHGNGFVTLYGHIKDGGFKVTTGQTVTQGSYIAEMGTTGNSTGVHLHFEVRQGGVSSSRMNAFFPCSKSVSAGADIPVDFPGLTS